MSPARALPPLPRAVLVLLGAAAYALFAWWLDRRTLGVAREAYFGAIPILLNALPGLLLALLLAALTRRPGFSLLVVAGLQALVYRIGAVKLEVLSDPIGLQDLYFITSPTPESFELLGEYVEHPWLLAGVVVAVAAVAGLAWWVERPAFRWFRATHVACALLGIGLAASLVAARQPWEGLYDEAALRPSKFRAMPGVLHAGLMSNLVYSHIRNARTFDTLDEAALARLLAEVPATPGPVAPARPDIVIVLSESLFDPRKLEGMAALPDAIPHLRAAIASGHGGEMKAPAYGGGTVRTEFEVLTGMPMDAFPEAQFPYVTLVRENIPSLVSQVERHGYRTLAIHGNAGSFWNRRNAYKAMGFDRFITKDEFPADAARDGRWISDAAMTDLVLEALRTAPGGAPQLIVALSMEAHGPYRRVEGVDTAEFDAIQVPPGLAPEEAEALRAYLYHARHADAQFARLLEAARDRPRPTVVLFFGDHLPGIRKVYDSLGFVDGRSGPRQLVPWVLWRSDREDAAVAGYDGEMRPWMLPARLLRLAGLRDDAWFELGGEVAARLEHARGAQRRMLSNGFNAAAVARINGSLPRRLEQAGRPGVAPE